MQYLDDGVKAALLQQICFVQRKLAWKSLHINKNKRYCRYERALQAGSERACMLASWSHLAELGQVLSFLTVCGRPHSAPHDVPLFQQLFH